MRSQARDDSAVWSSIDILSCVVPRKCPHYIHVGVRMALAPLPPPPFDPCALLDSVMSRSSFHVLQAKVDPEEIFTKLDRIGKGSFGEVFKGIDKRTQQVPTFQSYTCTCTPHEY